MNLRNISEKTDRASAFEFMRLLAMGMVVLGHCFMAMDELSEPLSAADNVEWMIKATTGCAVNLLFLLTGYFLRGGRFRLKRILKIWAKTIFYSVVIYDIVVLLGWVRWSVKEQLQYMLPVTFKQYWFMQAYMLLALILPYLAVMLENLTERKHFFLCVVLLLFMSVHQTFVKVANTLDTTQGYGILWAVVMVIIGNFLRRYGDRHVRRITMGVWLLGYVLTAVGIFVANYIIVRYDLFQGVISRGKFYAYNCLSMFLNSICLFCVFIYLSKTMKQNSVINYLSSNSLAAYLIASHPKLMLFFWTHIVVVERYKIHLPIYLAICAGLSAAVVLVCIFIDKFVDYLVGKIGLDKRMDKWITAVDRIFEDE